VTSTITEEERAEYARLRNAIDFREQYGFEHSAAVTIGEASMLTVQTPTPP
jgi:hypothetical protein